MTRFNRQCVPKVGNVVKLKQDAWAWVVKIDENGEVVRVNGKTTLLPLHKYGLKKGEIGTVKGINEDYIQYPKIELFQVYSSEHCIMQSIPASIFEVIE